MNEYVEIVNLTGHPIRLGNSSEVLHDMGKARVDSDVETVGTVIVWGTNELPILEFTEKEIVGLPEPHKGTLYVVSGIVAAKAMRNDVVAPGRISRAGNGRVTGCYAFTRPRRGIEDDRRG